MRILVVTPLSPLEKGGIEKVVGETAKLLVMNNNFEVQVCCGSLKDKTGSNFWNDISIKVYKTGKMTGYASMEMFKDIKRYAREFDVVHAHGFSTLIPLVAALSCDNTPLVLSPHFHPEASSIFLAIIKKIYDPLFGNMIFNKTKKVICVSETEKRFIQERFKVPDEKVVVIHNGVDLKQIYNSKPHNFKVNLILSVGRLEKYKNTHLVIGAIKYLPENFHFYIIGEGKYKNELKKMIQRYNLSDRVKILGSLSDDEMYRWIKTCTVFINLSEIEAFGITVLEALAADKPVIVNNKLSLAELANKFKGAVFPIDVEKTAPRELAEIIKETSNKNIEKVDLREFDWNYIANKVADLYMEIKRG